MTFYGNYDGHKCHMMATKYGNKGIKIIILISLLQINTKYSVFTDGDIKKTEQD